MIAIEKLFDDGEDVLSCNPDVTFLHNIFYLIYIPLMDYAKSVPNKKPPRRDVREAVIEWGRNYLLFFSLFSI